jgi:hypothetical protein
VYERAEQVKLMHQIFSYAVHVRVSLGRNSDDFLRAFNTVKHACEQRTLAVPLVKKGGQLFAAIAQLARAAWWDRLWV